MSRQSKKELDKVSNVKNDDNLKLKVAKRRRSDKVDLDDSKSGSKSPTVKKQKKDNPQKKPKRGDSVKRKIDFNQSKNKIGDTNNEQLNKNGNSTQVAGKTDLPTKVNTKVNSVADMPINDKMKLRNKSGAISGNSEPGKVQWTREFLDKVRKSNDKYRKKQDKHDKNCTVLQVVTRGDGIETLAQEIPDEDMELLDYDDDLSILDEEDLDKGEHEQPQPCTSADTSTQNWMEKLASVPEDELLNNPVLKKMMTKFFEEKFKDVQTTSASKDNGRLNVTKHVNHTVTDASGNIQRINCDIRKEINNSQKPRENREIKSPLDTTIYVPASHKKLTPNKCANILIDRGRFHIPSEQTFQNAGLECS